MLPIVVALLLVPMASLLALWLFGSRTPVDTRIKFDAGSIGGDLDLYLAGEEAKISGIKPGQHKQIVWADPVAKLRTKTAVVYVHGFSAAPGEARPLPDLVAEKLGANLFFTRLTGHGATPSAMGTTTVNALVNDLAEVVAVGERLGEKVVILATSSGAALTSWGLTQPEFSKRVSAAVLMSPNYAVRAFGASLLTFPGAKELARLLLGPTRSFEPANEAQRQLWTTSYPVEALLPMAEIVKLAVNAPVERVATPALFLISPQDKVVDPRITRRIAARWGAPHRLIEVEDVEDPSRHVLAGDAISPSTTHQIATVIIDWVDQTLPTS